MDAGQSRAFLTASTHYCLTKHERNPNLIAIGFRFLYGMRAVALMLLGVAGFLPRKFFVLNAIGTALWVATYYVSLGYVFGVAAEQIFARLGQQVGWIFASLAAVVLALVFWQKFQRKNLTKHQSTKNARLG